MGRRSAGLVRGVVVFLIGGGATISEVHGYAGELGSTGTPGQQVSTHHLYLTRALAVCAGFPYMDVRSPLDPSVTPDTAQEAEILAIFDELTDKGTLVSDGGATTWTNCTPSTAWSEWTEPTAAEVGCADADELTAVYPVLAGTPGPAVLQAAPWDPAQGCFSYRFGPWAGQFHFPQQDSVGDDLGNLRAWAVGHGDALQARALYGWGDGAQSEAAATTPNLWTGRCYDEQIAPLDTGTVVGGSLEAFGTYLHTLGDFYSHRRCRQSWGHRPTPPWYFHTNATYFQNDCAFNDHSFEFGCPDTERRTGFIDGTVDGAVAVFDELLWLARQKGYAPRLPSIDARGGWLRRQIERWAVSYDTNVDPQGAQCRIDFAYGLLKACVAMPPTTTQGCVADVPLVSGDCSDDALTACPDVTPAWHLTPSCAASTSGDGDGS